MLVEAAFVSGRIGSTFSTDFAKTAVGDGRCSLSEPILRSHTFAIFDVILVSCLFTYSAVEEVKEWVSSTLCSRWLAFHTLTFGTLRRMRHGCLSF